jgi:hypothetical protein
LSRERIAFSFAYKGGLYIIYECLQPIAMRSHLDAKPKIVDAPSTLNFRMGQVVRHSLFS